MSGAPVYEVAGAVDASARDHVTSGDEDVILVEQEDGSEYLIAQPKPDSGGDG
jgi:hypothetical protein